MNEKILVVDDEKSIVDILMFNLKKEGYQAYGAYDGEEALERFAAIEPDLIMLDLMMPKLSGYDVCRKIRQTSMVPIIMLTARAEEVDAVLGLELGADDYVTKPFAMRELLARVRANLRRSVLQTKSEENESILRIGRISLDVSRYEVRKDGKTLDLTLREIEIMKFLMSQKGQIFSREVLLKEIWGTEYYGDARTVDVTMRRLREKLEDEPSSPTFILTKRGLGYYFSDREE